MTATSSTSTDGGETFDCRPERNGADCEKFELNEVACKRLQNITSRTRSRLDIDNDGDAVNTFRSAPETRPENPVPDLKITPVR